VQLRRLALFAAAMLLAVVAASFVAVRAAHEPQAILIDSPLNGTVYPPDMTPPTFEFRDSSPARSWQVEVAFASGAPALRQAAATEPFKIGEIDRRCIANTNKLPEPTAEQAAARVWRPSAETWARIRQQAGTGPITVTLRGFAPADVVSPVSQGSTQLTLSADPVAAPIFFRDVPLMPSETEKGFIKPLASSAIPLINWSMRSVGEEKSHVVMTDLHTCANCHSFSADGKTLGLDMDGPQNDKALYAAVPVARQMTIRPEDMVSWSSFPTEASSPVRVGFMSQLSPDGRYVVTTTRPPDAKSPNFYYVSNFKDYRFLQVFYPTRGIVQYYDRVEKKLRPLPGASDSKYVQSNAVWSPDGKYLVFSRAEAKDTYPADGKMAAYANDPAEVPIQYDLYRIPFNDGRGGTPELIEGASHNGMSNSFPKISPDGKWIVWVQAKNGQLMRPDSTLWIVPFAGGVPRKMRCNTSLMNSWHSFSPNGRWMVFSSKSRSPYTQMFLTHIDEQGNDSPAIPIENATAANRAVNIPEFVNMPTEGIAHIATPAIDFYKQYDVAADLAKAGQFEAALSEWQRALAMSPADARALNNYGQTLSHLGRPTEAIAQYRKSIAAKPNYPEAQNNLAIALDTSGHSTEAIEHYQAAIDQNPGYAEAHNNLGRALTGLHRYNEAETQFEQALAINPQYAEAHNNLGYTLTAQHKLDEAIVEYRRALDTDPKYAHAWNNLGLAQAMSGRMDEATASFSKAVELDPADAQAITNLARAQLEKGDAAAAIEQLSRALASGHETAAAHTWLALAMIQQNRAAEARPHLERAIHMDPAQTEAQSALGMQLVMEGKPAEGLAHWQAALKADPNNVQVLNNTAWMLATAAAPELRNGRQAVELAQRAAKITRGQEPDILGTLAAALAEAGAFDKAIELNRQAADLAEKMGNTALAADLARRLERYQAHSPLRQP
jgi:tetratricopeptide (TPR) repeat protein